MKIDVLGVKIDDISMAEALLLVEKWIGSPGKPFDKAQGRHYIVTPNPEIVVAAQKDKRLKSILNNADLSIPDGVGLRLSGKVKNTVAGTDLMEKLIELSAEKGFTTGFLGGRDRVAEKTAERLKKKHPGLKVSFAESGGKVNSEGQWSSSSGRKAPLARPVARYGFVSRQAISSDINKNVSSTSSIALATSDFAVPAIDILFVAFGPPKQEKWIAGSLEKIPVKVAMGVGGAFDYLSGQVPRAPQWIRNLGFEWLFRLFIQPWRIRRQLTLVKYIWLLIIGR